MTPVEWVGLGVDALVVLGAFVAVGAQRRALASQRNVIRYQREELEKASKLMAAMAREELMPADRRPS